MICLGVYLLLFRCIFCEMLNLLCIYVLCIFYANHLSHVNFCCALRHIKKTCFCQMQTMTDPDQLSFI